MRTIARRLSALFVAATLTGPVGGLAPVLGAAAFVAVTAPACGPKRVVDTTAKTGLVLAKSIGKAQEDTKALTDLNLAAFPPERALQVQQALLRANTEVGKLPEFIRLAATAEEIQAGAGAATVEQIDAWLTILNVVSKEMGLAINGLPVDSVARQALEASRAAQQTATTFILELEKFKAATKQKE